jgi:hypothetical protein
MGIFGNLRGGAGQPAQPAQKTQFNTGGMARPVGGPPQPPSWVTSRPTGSPKQLDAQGKLGSGGKPAMTTVQVDARQSQMDSDWGMQNGYAKPHTVYGR